MIRLKEILAKRRARVKAARECRQLSRENRELLYRLSAETFTKADRDPEEAKEILHAELKSLGFDPGTIILMVKIGLLIYQTLVALDVFSPSPETVAALCEADEDA